MQAQLEKVKAELEMQSQHAARLENGCRALERSLGQSSKRLQVGTEPALRVLLSSDDLVTKSDGSL